MPIPISNTLQLAGQQNVTPWELPFAELDATLAAKQSTFDKAMETLTTAKSAIPQGGLHTTDLRNQMLEEYTQKEQALLADLEEGKINTGAIKSFASQIVNDPRNQALKYDAEVFSPNTAKLNYDGTLSNSAHNIMDKNGNYSQVSKVEDFANLGYVANQDAGAYISERLRTDITPYKSKIVEEINKKLGPSATGKPAAKLVTVGDQQYIVANDSSRSTEIESIVQKYMEEKIFTPNELGGLTYAEQMYNNNTSAINYLKQKHFYETGKEYTFEDFKNKDLLPIAQALLFENISTIKIDNEELIPVPNNGESKSNGGSGDGNIIDPDQLQLVPLLQGVHNAKIMLENFKKYSTIDLKEEPTLESLYEGINTIKANITTEKENGTRKANTLSSLFQQELAKQNINLPAGVSLMEVDEDGLVNPTSMTVEEYAKKVYGEKVTSQQIKEITPQFEKAMNYVQSSLQKGGQYDVFDHNSKMISQQQTLAQVEEVRNNLYKLNTNKTGIYEVEKKKLMATVPSSIGFNISSNILKNNNVSAEQLKNGNYVYYQDLTSLTNPTKVIYNLDNPAEKKAFEDDIELKAKGKVVGMQVNGKLDPSQVPAFIEREKEKAYSLAKEKISETVKDYENLVDEKLVEKLSDTEKKQIEAGIANLSDLQLRTQNIFFFNDMSMPGSSAEISARKHFQEQVQEGVKYELITLQDLSAVKNGVTNTTLSPEQQKYFNKIVKGTDVQFKTVDEDGKSQITMTTKVDGIEQSVKIGFKYDDGEIDSEGRPALKVMMYIPGISSKDGTVESQVKDLGLTDIVLDWVEVDVKSDGTLYKHLNDQFMGDPTSNFTKMLNNQRQNVILKDIETKGYTSTNLHKSNDNPKDDVNIEWQLIPAGKDNVEDVYAGYLTIGGKQNTGYRITAANPYKIAEAEQMLMTIANSPMTASIVKDGKYPPLAIEFAKVLKNGAEPNTADINSANTILHKLLNNKPAYTEAQFSATGVEVKKGQYKYIQEENQHPLTDEYFAGVTTHIQNNVNNQWSGNLIMGTDVSAPIITKDSEPIFRELVANISDYLTYSGIGDYDIVVEGGLRSLEKAIELQSKPGSGALDWNTSNHSLGKSVDITIKKGNSKQPDAVFLELENWLKGKGFKIDAHGADMHIHADLF